MRLPSECIEPNILTMNRRLGILLFALAAVSCGGSSETKYEVTGMLGIPSTTIVGANLIFIDAAVNGNPEQTSFGVLIDSGSPVVLIDPQTFGLPPPATVDDVKKIGRASCRERV